jgi:hypothetical protein
MANKCGEWVWSDDNKHKIKDRDGGQPDSTTNPPDGQITEFAQCTFLRVKTPETDAGQCWVFYAGNWYKVC